MMRLQQSGQALGCEVVLTLVVDSEPLGQEILASLRNKIHEFEKRFSRFLPNSELSEFNACAGQKVVVSTEFKRLLQASQELMRETNGVFSPFVLPALQRAGYVKSWTNPDAAVHAQTVFTDRRVVASFSDITYGKQWARIPAETAVDFGGCGKGYLLDELSVFLDKQKLGGYWLSLGGDIICNGHDSDGKAWEIFVSHATTPDETVGSANNSRQKTAVATSGITKRKGQGWHHIINPATGKPAKTDILTATVVCSQAVCADVYAKCLVILGGAGWRMFCEQNHQIQTAWVQTKATETGKIYINTYEKGLN